MVFVQNKNFKYILNFIFLALSTYFIIKFLLQLTTDPVNKWIMIIFAIVLEIFAQWILALGRISWKQNKSKAFVLFLAFAVYVIVYAGLGGISFFVTEIGETEEAAAKMTMLQEADRDRLNQINITIDNLNKQLELEANTGFGRRSAAIMGELKTLSEERKIILGHLATSQETQGENVSVNAFAILGKVFNTSPDFFKILIFAVSTFMIYFGLIITSWDLKESVTGVTKNVTDKKANVANYSKGLCPICDTPLRGKQKYCSDKCRQTAHRNPQLIFNLEKGG